jgi:hypothetical protein
LNSEAPSTKEWEGQRDKQRKVYCTTCNEWKRKDKFDNIAFKRLPTNTCIESTCKSCLKNGGHDRPRDTKRAQKEESKSSKHEGLTVADQESFSSVSFGADSKNMQLRIFQLEFEITKLREEGAAKDTRIKELEE